MMYYLAEYQVFRLDPQVHVVLAARDRQQGHWQQPSGCLVDSARIRNLVWVLSSGPDLRLVPSGARHVSVADSGPFDVWAAQLGGDTLDYVGFTFGGTCDARPPLA
jgi:hypothetical protein